MFHLCCDDSVSGRVYFSAISMTNDGPLVLASKTDRGAWAFRSRREALRFLARWQQRGANLDGYKTCLSPVSVRLAASLGRVLNRPTCTPDRCVNGR